MTHCDGGMNKRRGPIAAEFSGPGPAAIALPTLFGNANIRESNKPKSPAFSFGLKNKPDSSPVSPSPNTYNTSGLTTKGKGSAVASSLHVKVKDPKQFVTPSPGAYNPQNANKETKISAPNYSFGIKPPPTASTHGPAPNMYSVGGASQGSAAYSLAARTKKLKQFLTPAPGNYETCAVDKYKDKSPNYSLSMRYSAPGDKTGKPGPGAYMSEKVNTKRTNPEYSFGVKHSKFVFMAKPDPSIPSRPLPY